MRSTTWTHRLATTLAIAAMGLFAVACSKSTEKKETNTQKVNGHKPDKAKGNQELAKGTPDSPKTTATTNRGTNPDTPIKKATTTTTTTKPGTKPGKKGGYKLLANTPEYTLKLVYPANLDTGKSATARVVLTAKTGWKLNKEYPTKLRIVSPEGTSVNKATQKRTDAVRWAEKSAEWQVEIKADAAGTKPFTGKFKFAVCTENTCDPKKELLAWVVNVK